MPEPAASAAESSSAWPSRGRCCAIRGLFWRTNPRPRSIPRREEIFARFFAGLRISASVPWLSFRTIRDGTSSHTARSSSGTDVYWKIGGTHDENPLHNPGGGSETIRAQRGGDRCRFDGG